MEGVLTLEELTLVWEGGGSAEPIKLDGILYSRYFGRAEEDIEEGGTGTITLDRPDTGVGNSNDDWVVLKGKPWRCACGATSPYMAEDATPHRVIVWPSPDDPNLVKLREQILQEDGEQTEVLSYEVSMGPCVSHYSATPS